MQTMRVSIVRESETSGHPVSVADNTQETIMSTKGNNKPPPPSKTPKPLPQPKTPTTPPTQQTQQTGGWVGEKGLPFTKEEGQEIKEKEKD